jgi:hypothetical protein
VKFNFKKIASVIASTVMLSSTVALAAAANYPAPFVQNGVADVAVVYGSAAAQTDLVAATDITTNLNSKLVATTTGPTTVAGGDFVKLEKSTDKFNLGEDMNDFYSTLDEDQLSVVLAAGVYTNDANDDFDFDQKIALGDLALEFFQNDDFNEGTPLIGFEMISDNHILNYTLDFTPDAADCGDFGLSTSVDDDCETTDLTMLGRTYYIVKTESVAVNGVKITLLDAANSAMITEGESQSIVVGSSSYDVSINFVDATDVILDVNGVRTNKLAEGDVFKVGTDLYIGVKNILYSEKESGISKVEVSLGSGKIVLEHNQEVQLNNEDISDISDSIITAYITNTTTELDKIVLEWNLEDDAWIAPGTDLVLPGFETIKLSMGGFVEPSKEVTSLKNDGDSSIKLSTTVADGAVSFNLLYANSTEDGWGGIGKTATKRLATNSSNILTLDDDLDEWFVASTLVSADEAESYVLKIKSIDDSDPAKNTTTLESVASGSTKGVDLDLGETDEIGDISFTLNKADKNSGVIQLTLSGKGTETFDTLYTKDGLTIDLPVNQTAAVIGRPISHLFNVTSNLSATYVLNMTEENENGDIGIGDSFNATLGFTTDKEAQVSDVDVNGGTGEPQTEDSDTYINYVISPLATKSTFNTGGDPDTADFEYHGEESYGEVYVSETVAAVVTGEASSRVLAVKDSESVSAKNLIVVGGSCINSVAANLLGGALCGADFEASAGVGAGSFLIETFARDGGGVATLVAGYNAADTTNAAKYLTTQTVDTTAGKKYKGTTATSATLEVA